MDLVVFSRLTGFARDCSTSTLSLICPFNQIDEVEMVPLTFIITWNITQTCFEVNVAKGF